MPYDLNPHSITPIPGPKTITVKSDYLIDTCFCDPETGEAVLDCTGDNAVTISELLETLPSEALAKFVESTAVQMLMLAKGVG